MIKVILWDIDGTLLNFKAAEKAALRKCFEDFGLGVLSDEMLKEYSAINDEYWRRLERKELTKPEILIKRFEDFFALHDIDLSIASDFNHAYLMGLGDTIVMQDHAMETLEYFKGKKLQCCATNGVKFAQEKKLRNSGMDQIFDHIFISEVVGYEKPDRRFFDGIFDVIGKYEKDEVLFVGDSLTGDIKGANNADILSCFYNPNHKPVDLDVRVDFEIDDISKVIDIVNAAE